MRGSVIFALAVSCLTAVSAEVAVDGLVEGWKRPPDEARPHMWWHWMNGNVTKAGITADLEAMKRVGVGGVQVFDVGLELPEGAVAFDTPSWYEHIAFAAKEASRLGLSFGVANCSGWTSSGGPWITPELSMKKVVYSKLSLTGPRRIKQELAAPADSNGFYADIATIAFPTPASTAKIPDFDRQVFRLRGDERGPVLVDPLPGDAILQSACVDRARIVDLTDYLTAEGVLKWDVPDGDWTVLRVGYAAIGQKNRPPSRTGGGLESDKLSRRATDVHFDAYVGKVAAAVRGCKAFDNVLIDSYEVKGQNWTRGFEKEFLQRIGSDIHPYLPVFAGYPVGSVVETKKFLSDFRRVVSELFCENYAGRMAERCHEIGARLACEPYGNGPFNDLAYAEKCDIPMSEFWTLRGDGVPMWTRWGHRWRGNGRVVASTAHFWGKDTVGAEAFTAYPTETSGRWLEHPYSMKAQGDMVLADGVNRFYFHRYAHQPWTDPARYPGMTMAYYGSHFERTQTWWENGFKAYLDYLTRVQYLLRCGTFVADVLICTGDEAPDFGTAGEAPDGWRSDHCTAAALKKIRRDADGRYVSPGGVSYRVVAKPGDDIEKMLRDVGCERDFICADRNVSWIHRRTEDEEIYFVATAAKMSTRVTCSFRDAAGSPELWDPETGTIERAVCRRTGSKAEIDLSFDPAGSIFVVFRKRPTQCAVKRPILMPVGEREIKGPWGVSFKAPGASSSFVRHFGTLTDWSRDNDEQVRYFSGTATYETSVRMDWKASRVFVDLGDVRDIAEVSVNGVAFRTLWKPPYRVDVTEALRGVSIGENVRLSVKVTNRWPNRLIGDERLHRSLDVWRDDNGWKRPILKEFPSWLAEGGGNPSGATTFSTCRLWRGDDELLSSGLLGPVKVELCCISNVNMRAIAHRGLHGPGVAQNSVDSFKAAFKAGAKWIETDFHQLANGRIICVHDRCELKNVSGVDREIVELTAADVEAINIGKAAKTPRPVRMPYLEDVLAVIPKDVIAQCEIKLYGKDYADKFDEARREAGLSETNILVTSFQLDWLADFKRRYPKYQTGWLGCGVGDSTFDLDKAIEEAVAAGCSVFCPGAVKAEESGFGSEDSARVREAGLDFRLFGVNSVGQLSYATSVRATAFTSDHWRQSFEWAKSVPGLQLTP